MCINIKIPHGFLLSSDSKNNSSEIKTDSTTNLLLNTNSPNYLLTEISTTNFKKI